MDLGGAGGVLLKKSRSEVVFFRSGAVPNIPKSLMNAHEIQRVFFFAKTSTVIKK